MSDKYKEPSLIQVLRGYLRSTTFFNEARKIATKLESYGITKYDIHTDYSVTVKGNVNFANLDLQECPFNFRKVTGDFRIGYSNFNTLKGCPKIVGGDYIIEFTKVKNLEFGPEKVGKDYIISLNEIDSLRSPLKKLGGRLEFIGHDFTERIPEFERYYNGAGLILDLETINEVYKCLDLNEKLDRELPQKDKRKNNKL